MKMYTWSMKTTTQKPAFQAPDAHSACIIQLLYIIMQRGRKPIKRQINSCKLLLLAFDEKRKGRRVGEVGGKAIKSTIDSM